MTREQVKAALDTVTASTIPADEYDQVIDKVIHLVQADVFTQVNEELRNRDLEIQQIRKDNARLEAEVDVLERMYERLMKRLIELVVGSLATD